MPSFVPRDYEPYKRRELLDKRLLALRGAINAGTGIDAITCAVEDVRHAALGIVKARRSILAGRREDDALAKQLENLRRDAEYWLGLSGEAIAAMTIGTGG